MRKPKVKNKYKLTYSDVIKLQVADRSKIGEPLFWRNTAINAWCISETTVRTPADDRYGTYNDYWIGIYDEDSKLKRKFRVSCSALGGMATYKFKKFFDYREIENEKDLEIQEKLLSKINELIDLGILKRPPAPESKKSE